MLDNVLVSIVIPVYNTKAEFIKECIESIVDIKYPHEIIVVDDGSYEKDTLEFLEEIKEYKNTRLLKKVNGGLSSARNFGIKNATGKYILPLDSDDLLISKNLELALDKLLSDENIDIVYGDFQNFGDKNTYNKSGEFSRMKIAISGNYVSAVILYKKEVWDSLGGYDITFNSIEDWDFSSRAAVFGYNFTYLAVPLFKYRRIFNGKSLSQNDLSSYIENKKRVVNNVPREFFSKKNINDYVLTSFKREKKLFFKTAIILFFPWLYRFLLKKGVFKNDIIVD
jgi:glycosyltransferase involved in cell wall biosynthesis